MILPHKHPWPTGEWTFSPDRASCGSRPQVSDPRHEACQSNPFPNSFSPPPTLNASLIPLEVSSRTATERHRRNSELFPVSSAGRSANREIRAPSHFAYHRRDRLNFLRSRYLDEPTCFPFWMHDRRVRAGKREREGERETVISARATGYEKLFIGNRSGIGK